MMDAEKLIRDTIAKLSSQQESANAQKLEAFEGLLNELSSMLGDVVAALEREPDQALADAITKGLRELRVNVAGTTVNVAAPSVSVAAPSVNVTPTLRIDQSTPLVLKLDQPAATAPAAPPTGPVKFEVDFRYSHGVPVGMTITRNQGS